MRCVTSYAALSLQRRVFVGEWTLLISVTLNASRIAADGEPRLLEFKPPMRIVTVTALYDAFEDLVMKRHTKRRLHLAMATHAKLRVACLKHVDRRETRLLSVRGTDENI